MLTEIMTDLLVFCDQVRSTQDILASAYFQSPGQFWQTSRVAAQKSLQYFLEIGCVQVMRSCAHKDPHACSACFEAPDHDEGLAHCLCQFVPTDCFGSIILIPRRPCAPMRCFKISVLLCVS